MSFCRLTSKALISAEMTLLPIELVNHGPIEFVKPGRPGFTGEAGRPELTGDAGNPRGEKGVSGCGGVVGGLGWLVCASAVATSAKRNRNEPLIIMRGRSMRTQPDAIARPELMAPSGSAAARTPTRTGDTP